MSSQSLADKAREALGGGDNPGQTNADLAYQNVGGGGGGLIPPTESTLVIDSVTKSVPATGDINVEWDLPDIMYPYNGWTDTPFPDWIDLEDENASASTFVLMEGVYAFCLRLNGDTGAASLQESYISIDDYNLRLPLTVAQRWATWSVPNGTPVFGSLVNSSGGAISQRLVLNISKLI